jgi:hypothetical protein
VVGGTARDHRTADPREAERANDVGVAEHHGIRKPARHRRPLRARTRAHDYFRMIEPLFSIQYLHGAPYALRRSLLPAAALSQSSVQT